MASAQQGRSDRPRPRLGPAVASALLIAVAGCGVAASPAPSQPALSGYRMVDPDPASDGGPTAVVSHGPGLLGVGGDRAWSTGDGIAWDSVALPDAGKVRAVDITVRDGVAVAVGSVDRAGAAWTSADGSSWAPATGEPGPRKGFVGAELNAVASGPPGLVATGRYLPGGTEAGRERTAAWWSEDGREWHRSDTALAGTAGTDVLWAGDAFVLVARDWPFAGADVDPVFYWSADGRAWTAGTQDQALEHAWPAALAARGGTVVAMGTRWIIGPDGAVLAPAAWTSSDGKSWRVAPDSPGIRPWAAGGPTPPPVRGAIQGTDMTGVVEVGGAFLAVGTQWGLDPAADRAAGRFLVRGAVLWSGDGLAWAPLPNDLLAATAAHSLAGNGVAGVAVFRGSPLLLGGRSDLGRVVWVAGP